ncbi:hypothetical protein SK128_010147 [Halocaridina rubra]|uniref:Uncharacterized protein n=1 Tax=Halocaridina rubra TaxID=373956 RepID=A0AAN9A4X8_HALRR
MSGTSYAVFLACVGMALAMRTHSLPKSVSSSSLSAGKDPTKVLMKRDFKGSDLGGGGSHASGHGASAPLDSYGTSGPGENGYYYYYYPVDEATGEKDIFGDKKDKCDAAKIMAPLIVIAVFLGIIAANAIGLLPALNLANINFGNLNLPGIQIGTGLGVVAGTGRRDLDDSYYEEYSSWGPLEKLTTIVTSALDSEQCLSRLVCESGKYAEGRTTVLSILEIITPPEYQNRMKIFKDSALKKSDCKTYKCSYTDKLF